MRNIVRSFPQLHSVNWIRMCTPIRDQGDCGSCTAFGSLGTIEANINIIFHNLMDLSERDLFFCAGGTCDGGDTMEAILDKAKEGITSESICPYSDKDSPCDRIAPMDREHWKEVAVLKDYITLTDVRSMKNALQSGPLVGVMDVHESFLHYQDGIYHSLGIHDPVIGGHCICVIGYDEEIGAWLVRNSWGEGWGMSGYAWVKYGDSEIDNIMYQVTPELVRR